MKLLSLDLLAYGPFTAQALDFSTGHPGLVVLHGANETGKSSALRALRALLYGFPSQSQDAAFLHPYPSLRVGATLQHSDGRVLRVLRRKGTKDT
ncbi:MAG: AAA family ATPase, partial [Deltaproteobacteria bacterium]|nr:AAA family ATPase [Deltaproteobacteria bacterium]